MPLNTTNLPFDLNLIVNSITLFILILYLFFAAIVVRQVNVMSKILITPASAYLKAISIVHIGFAIGLVVLAVGLLTV